MAGAMATFAGLAIAGRVPGAASAAGAAVVPNLQKFGVGPLGVAPGEGLPADLSTIPAADIARCAANSWHIRAPLNPIEGISNYQTAIASMMAAGVSVLPVIIWKNGVGEPITPGHAEWSKVTWRSHCDDIAAMLDALGEDGPQQVQIWNEPNSMDYWNGTARSAGKYVEQMLVPAYRAFNAIDRSIAIVLGGLQFRERSVDVVDDPGPPVSGHTEYRNRRAESWLRDFVGNGGHRYIDRWAIHPYGRTNKDGDRVADAHISWERALREIRRFKHVLNELAQNHPAVRMPIWVTETGLSVRHNDFTEADQRAFLRNLVNEVEDAGGYGVRVWSNWPLRDPFASSPDLYYSGLYRSGASAAGAGADRKPAGDWWAARAD